MAYSIMHRDLHFAHGAASRALHKLGSYREHGAVVTQQVVQTVFTGVGAFGFSWLSGYAGTVDVLGVPIDLGSGILLQLAGFSGLGGKWSKILHDLGDGALAAYFAKLGARTGNDMRRKHGLPSAKGERMLASGERRRISANELTAMAMAQRA